MDQDCLIPGNNVIPANATFIGDPCGVYQDEDTGKILYNPRGYTEGMEQWVLDWLVKHPEWPEIKLWSQN